MELSRRGFIKITGAGLAASSLGALGFGFAGEALAASVRPFKLTAASETRNTCTYCSVACGILTLPAALAIRNPTVGALFCKPDPEPDDLRAIAEAFASRLGDAEAYLDLVAEEARTEAEAFSIDPTPLLALVDQTRKLSGR